MLVVLAILKDRCHRVVGTTVVVVSMRIGTPAAGLVVVCAALLVLRRGRITFGRMVAVVVIVVTVAVGSFVVRHTKKKVRFLLRVGFFLGGNLFLSAKRSLYMYLVSCFVFATRKSC